MDYDIVVVGGGPVGCAAARDLATGGARVLIIEEHAQIGEPLQCAGLVSAVTLNMAKVSPKVVVNEIKGAIVYSPGGYVLKLNGKKTYALAIDRPEFDRELAKQAKAAGVEVISGHRVTGFEYIENGVRIFFKNQKQNASSVTGCSRKIFSFTCSLIIGADGYNSLIARKIGTLPPSENIFIYAEEVELTSDDDSLIKIFLGQNIAPGWFGYVIPLGRGRARIGVGRGDPRKVNCPRLAPKDLFENITKAYAGLFGNFKMIRGTSGVIPLGLQKKIFGHRVLLVGDAACQIKPISGGGLFLGLSAVKHCVKTALEALKNGDSSETFLASYQREWEKEFGREISCGLKCREMFLKLRDKDMDTFINFFNKPYWRKIILKYSDLDYHSNLAQKINFAPPWAMTLIGNGLGNLQKFWQGEGIV